MENSILMKKANLPKDWKIVKVGEFVNSVKGKKPKRISKEKTKECGIPYVNIKAFEKNIIDEYTDGVGCVLCDDGDFLMVWDGSRSGYVGKGIKGALGSTLVKLDFPNIENNYAYYFLQSKFLDINTRAKGVGIPHVDPNILWNYDLLIPPKLTQRAIVSKIEELFSEIEKGIESLFTAQQQLKTYRQSVLKWAFEGKLTNSLNSRNGRDRYDSNDLREDFDLTIAAEDEADYKTEKNHSNQNNHINHSSDKGELPKGWKWISISHIADVNPKLPNKEKINEDLEIQFLPMKLVEEIVNKIHLDEIKTFKEVQKKSYTPFINGDIIFAKVTPCMENGKIAIVEKLKNGIGYGSSEFHVLRCSNDALNKYLFYFLVQDKFRNEAQNAMTGAVGLRRVPKQFVENHAIPLPPTKEQNEIVEAIESRLSVADKMEESITQSLQQAEGLRQSILKKAFEGKLI